MTTIQSANGGVADPEREQPVPGHGTCECQRGEGSRRQRGGDEKIEVRHPGLEYRPGLPVEVDRQGDEHALPDQEADLAREGHPGEIVEELGQLRVPFRAEGGEEPEQVGDQEERGSAGRAPEQGIREDRRAMRHPANLQHDQHQDRDQPHAEPVEQDHAVADAREVLRVAIESGDLLRRHRRRHRVDEAWK